jgi:hypothetical protein
MNRTIITVGLVLGLTTLAWAADLTATSPTCGSVRGSSTKDVQAALTFCAKAIPANGSVVGVRANDDSLRVSVIRQFANEMMADRLSAERLVQVWITGWEQERGVRGAWVHVEWEGVEIARGEPRAGGRSEVTIKSR